jgi:hypothetical protein
MNPRRLVVVVLLLAAGCAAKIPAETSFNRTEWSAVEAIPPGLRVEVQYVTGTPPLRHSFEGKLRAASADMLEIETKDGIQRLLPNRVLRVGVGGRENRMIELGITGFFAGALLGGLSLIDPPNDDAVKYRVLSFGVGGAALGGLLGARRGQARPRVVYSREVR